MVDPVLTAVTAITAKAATAVTPKLMKKCAKVVSELGEELHHAFVGAFVEAITQTYEKHSYFSSIIFPNRQLRLYDYYLPLTLSSTSNKGESEELAIDSYPGSLLTSKKDVLIVDSAGMGKSTILKYIYLRTVECNAGIPIFIELRKIIKPGQGILQNIVEQLKSSCDEINEKFVKKLISDGEFIFFFDGYDEIPDDVRGTVTADLIEFKRRANKNIYILSSREMPGLSAFKDFYRYNIRPLGIEEAYELIRRYSERQEIADDLIEKLELDKSGPIQEFLKNPLLVSLLYKAYEYKKNVPIKKHVFYRQVFEALFENHDLSKDAGELNRKKKTGLDIHSFELVMRAVGFTTLATSKIEYSKDELILLLESAQRSAAPIKFNPHHLYDDLTVAVPLFAVDGSNIRWQHKSLQEYFAALYVSAAGPESQTKIIGRMFSSSKAASYVNFLTLFCDIDPRGGRNVVTKLLTESLISDYEETVDFPGINPVLSKHRRMLNSGMWHVITNSEDAANSLGRVVKSKSSGPWNDLTTKILRDANRESNVKMSDVSRSMLRHGRPGCLSSISNRSTFLRSIADFLLVGEEDCQLNIPIKTPSPELKNMPDYFATNKPGAYPAEPENFSQINEIIFTSIHSNEDFRVFDIDKLRRLDKTIEIEKLEDTSDVPPF